MNPDSHIEVVSQAARFYWTMSRGDGERAFQQAQRHSRLVRFMRAFLPALIAVATAGVTVSTYLDSQLTPSPIRVGSVVVSGSRVTMDRPQMSGFTQDGRVYELRADAAVQDIIKPNEVELLKIDAEVQMEDLSTVRLISPKGIYNSKDEKLKLAQSVLITSTKGYQGRLKEARVDMRKGYVVSDKPVEMTMLQGTLSANRMEIIDSGDLIRFEHHVQLTTILNTFDIKRTATDDDDANDRTDVAATTVVSGKIQSRLIVTPLPRADPRRALAPSSAPRSTSAARLPIPKLPAFE